MALIDLTKTRTTASDLFAWLNANFGPSHKGRWKLVDLSYIDIPNEKDAMLFTLRWS